MGGARILPTAPRARDIEVEVKPLGGPPLGVLPNNLRSVR